MSASVTSSTALPGPMLGFYADDFSGAADVMEVLGQAGLKTRIFLEVPSNEDLTCEPDLFSFGVAGGTRAMGVEAMTRELTRAFQRILETGARLVHYKICSTFDSSPEIGSIGRAIEIGRKVFGSGAATPLVVGAPALGRYVVFGNLFARSGIDSEPFRLDRHPTMRCHPVTPMVEADLRLVLAAQTGLSVGLVDVLALERGMEPDKAADFLPPGDILVFDTLRLEHLEGIGRFLARSAVLKPQFVAGSSGVEYALVEAWKQGADGLREPFAIGPSLAKAARAVETIVAVSGSCSPVTERQIRKAIEAGFIEISLNCEEIVRGRLQAAAQASLAEALRSGRSVVMHSSRGAGDARFRAGLTSEERNQIGAGLGLILEAVIRNFGIGRAAICGGDSSMQAARALGIAALDYLGPMAPGSPLCKVRAPGRAVDDCEIVFKGGQVGRDRFFLDLLCGGPAGF